MIFFPWNHLSFTFFLPLWDTTKEVFFRCGIQRKRFFPLWDTTEKIFLHCGIQQKRIFFFVGYNGEQSQDVKQILFYCIPQCRKFFFRCILYFNRILCSVLYPRKIFSIVPTMPKVFFHCIPQWKMFSSVVDTMAEVFFRCGIQRKKLSSIVGYNRRGFFHCRIQRKRFFSVVGYNGKKTYNAEWNF